MALIRCPDCKKDISDAAVACPFCGRPSANQRAISESAAKDLRPTYETCSFKYRFVKRGWLSWNASVKIFAKAISPVRGEYTVYESSEIRVGWGYQGALMNREPYADFSHNEKGKNEAFSALEAALLRDGWEPDGFKYSSSFGKQFRRQI
jgi:hypothetical protein